MRGCSCLIVFRSQLCRDHLRSSAVWGQNSKMLKSFPSWPALPAEGTLLSLSQCPPIGGGARDP